MCLIGSKSNSSVSGAFFDVAYGKGQQANAQYHNYAYT